MIPAAVMPPAPSKLPPEICEWDRSHTAVFQLLTALWQDFSRFFPLVYVYLVVYLITPFHGHYADNFLAFAVYDCPVRPVPDGS